MIFTAVCTQSRVGMSQVSTSLDRKSRCCSDGGCMSLLRRVEEVAVGGCFFTVSLYTGDGSNRLSSETQ